MTRHIRYQNNYCYLLATITDNDNAKVNLFFFLCKSIFQQKYFFAKPPEYDLQFQAKFIP